jgi:hypothetical protein
MKNQTERLDLHDVPLLRVIEKSDRLKAIAPDIAGYGEDLRDVHILLAMMHELITKDDDLSEETIDRFFALWRSAWPLLDQSYSELKSIMRGLQE